jgi:hypothetical protein
MPLDRTATREHLRAFRFSELFTQELGWDWPDSTAPLPIVVRTEGGNRAFELLPVAHKRGVVAYHCPAPAGTAFPDSSLRQKIETATAKSGPLEHVILFTDASRTQVILQTSLRRPGQPVRRPEYRFDLSGSGEALLQRLDRLIFTLDQEEALTVIDVVQRLESATVAEKVTKKFYDRFAKERETFTDFIKGIQAEGDRSWYASVMLNRLMFVYFIQAKGFLDENTTYLADRLEKVRALAGKNQFHSFYRGFLLKLFHDGLGKREPERQFDAQLSALIGRVPYLNGGLFDVHALERDNPAITIPDEAFERLFKFFGDWRWHLDERPLREQGEINPDVLGYIFEKYINQKQMGAYYTKEDITDYISKNCVLPWLFQFVETHLTAPADRAAFTTYWQGLLQENPDAYIYQALRHGVSWDYHAKSPLATPRPLPPEIEAGVAPASLHNPVGAVESINDLATLRLRKPWQKTAPADYALPTEIWREVVSRRQRYAEVRAQLTGGQVTGIADFITLNLDIRQFFEDLIARCPEPRWLRHLWHALKELTVLDPTCGSGAFLFAGLNLLQPLYEGVLQRMEQLLRDAGLDVPVIAPTETRPEKAEKTFQRVLAQVNDPAKHPTRRYFVLKEIILRNLYGVDIMAEAVEICKLRLFLKLVAQVESDTAKPNLGVEPLPDVDFNVRAGNTLVGFATRQELEKISAEDFIWKQEIDHVLTAAEDADQLFDTFRKSQEDGDSVGQREVKGRLKTTLEDLRTRCDRALAEIYEPELSTKPKKFAAWQASHQPFHWYVEFYGIMSRGGFAVIIGNPPYVEANKVRGQYGIKGYATESAENLYAFVLERSNTLMRKGSKMGMIVPIGASSLAETASLRNCMTSNLQHLHAAHFAIRPAKLFNGVEQRLTIFLGECGKACAQAVNSTRYHQWKVDERDALFQLIQFTEAPSSHQGSEILKPGDPVIGGVLTKVNSVRNLTAESEITRLSGDTLYFHRTPGYWVRIMDFLPFFKSPSGDRSIHHIREIKFSNHTFSKAFGSIISSSLYFLWLFASGNCRNLTMGDVLKFPTGKVPMDIQKQLSLKFSELMKNFKENSFTSTRGDAQYQEFDWGASKHIIDEIDCVLAQHYGFTEEELDFIVNYDIKYRLGADAGVEED